jgi:hypothetical protein
MKTTFSTAEAAEYLDMEVGALKNHIYRTGALKVEFPGRGRTLIFKKADLDKFARERRPPGRPWGVIDRHKWVEGCLITESLVTGPVQGVPLRRYTATIRGHEGWKIYQGPVGPGVLTFVAETVTAIRHKIDAGDGSVFDGANEYAVELP